HRGAGDRGRLLAEAVRDGRAAGPGAQRVPAVRRGCGDELGAPTRRPGDGRGQARGVAGPAPIDADPLTAKEFAVLHQLIAAGGAPVRRQDLIAAAWDELVPPASNVLDVVVAQLRRKLGQPQVVLTVRGVGYALR